MEKLFVYDLETTGTNPKRHGIHQIAVMIYINGRLVDTIYENMRIYSDQEIEQEALELCNITPEHLFYYQNPNEVYQKLIKILSKYCDRDDRNDRFTLLGYSNSTFDNLFFREFFLRNNDNDFDKYFYREPIDVYMIAAFYLSHVRDRMENFRLETIAEHFLGVNAITSLLHTAIYDAALTYRIYLKLKEKIKMEDHNGESLQKNLPNL